MLLWWVGVALILQPLQRRNELCSSVPRLDHLVHVAASGGDIRIGKLLDIIVYQLLPFDIRILSLLDLVFEDNVNSAVYSHHRDLGGWPGVIDIAAHMLAAHHIVGAAVSLASNDGHFGYRCLAVGVEQLGSVADDAPMFLSHSGKESRHIFECHNRNIKAVAEANKPCAFVRRIDIQYAG